MRVDELARALDKDFDHDALIIFVYSKKESRIVVTYGMDHMPAYAQTIKKWVSEKVHCALSKDIYQIPLNGKIYICRKREDNDGIIFSGYLINRTPETRMRVIDMLSRRIFPEQTVHANG